MEKKALAISPILTLIFLIGVLMATCCTDSCYKDEENYADAGDSSGPPPDSDTGSTEGCMVGSVYYQLDMTHPDKPCLVCIVLDDNKTKGWTPLDDGSWCDDGKFCTGEGVCDRGRCKLEGNPCPPNAPYCSEDYGGVCSDTPFEDDDDAWDDDDDEDCWACETSAECMDLFGEDWGCLENCCVQIVEDDDVVDDDDDDDDDDDSA